MRVKFRLYCHGRSFSEICQANFLMRFLFLSTFWYFDCITNSVSTLNPFDHSEIKVLNVVATLAGPRMSLSTNVLAALISASLRVYFSRTFGNKHETRIVYSRSEIKSRYGKNERDWAWRHYNLVISREFSTQ